MNDNDEIRRLKRFIVISWAFLLLVVVGLVLWGSIEIRSLNSAVQLAYNRQPEVIRGIDGKDGQTGAMGAQGLAGMNGTNGTNGQGITSEEIASAVSDYLAANPPTAGAQGNPGMSGVDGLTLQVQVDPVTCQLESKYSISDVWFVLAQLSLPCEPSQ